MGSRHRNRKESKRPRDDDQNAPVVGQEGKSDEKKDAPDTLSPKKPDFESVAIPRIRSFSPDVPRKGLFPKKFTFDQVALPLVDDGPQTLCLLFPQAREGILALRGFPARLPRAAKTLSRDPPYDIVRVPGAGQGLVANTALNPGDLIICERPLLLFPAAFPNDKTGRGTYLRDMVKSLPPKSRAAVYDMHNCTGSDDKSARGIVDTNSLRIGALPGSYEGAYAVLCPRIGLLNHSCSPNAERYWDLKSMALYVRALRPIAKGEQICISYCPVLQSRAARQATLSKWSFTCACAICSLPKAETRQSDVRRWVLDTSLQSLTDKPDFRDHEGSLKRWAEDPTLPDDHVSKHSEMQLRLMEEEGVYVKDLWFAHCEIVCKALCALEDRAGVVELAKKAAVMSTIYRGTRGRWHKVAAAPEKTSWWGLRKKSPGQETLD